MVQNKKNPSEIYKESTSRIKKNIISSKVFKSNLQSEKPSEEMQSTPVQNGSFKVFSDFLFFTHSHACLVNYDDVFSKFMSTISHTDLVDP
jgi:hypothetical protein